MARPPELTAIEQLRERLTDEYRAACHALDIVAEYLTERHSNSSDDRIVALLGEIRHISSRHSSRLSHRQRVMQVIADEEKSVLELSLDTGLTEKQVRAVLYDPDIKERVTTSSSGGTVRFRLCEPERAGMGGRLVL